MNILRLLRIKHWVKNTFIFLPLFFAGKIHTVFESNILLVFLAFCLAASTVYILNDILDAEEDKMHPEKRNRPIASGKITKRIAFLFFVLFLFLSIGAAFFLEYATIYVIGYLVLNLFYVFLLKKIPIVDVSSISLGFVLRIIAGAAECQIYLSHWMIILVFLLTISIAFAKRRYDLTVRTEQVKTLKHTTGYSIQFLDLAKSITFSITLISYILYSISPEVIERLGSDKIYITSLFVFLGILRYLQITITDQNSGSPVDLLLRDRFLQSTVVLWLLAFLYIIYG